MNTPTTLFEKVWANHIVVDETPGTPAVLYIDLHIVHEVTTPQAFSVLRANGLPVRRPDLTLATLDHSTPTTPVTTFKDLLVAGEGAANQVRQMEQNCEEFGLDLLGYGSGKRGIVHVIGPELGATQPGKTIVCGDSHSSTHGAFGALAFGIGTFVEPRAVGSPVSGNLEAPTGRDLSEVSNEEMEAVLEQFADVPEANRMRLALARRYFEEQDFGSAVGHFQTVLANEPSPAEASEALGRIGWILFVNGELTSAEAAYLQAIDALPNNSEAKWFYSILLLESERQDEAVPFLEDLAADPTVPEEALEEIQRLLDEVGT